MHSRSPYHDTSLDFLRLARKYPSFGKLVKGSTIDFKDAAINREISRCLLLDHHGLDVTFPEDRLCPRVPNRLNYVLWIEDLVAETRPDDQQQVIGVDIGTGSSVIYPLLCCKQNPSWRVYGLEVDEESIASAQANVSRNVMQDRVLTLKSDLNDPRLLSQHECISMANERLTFTMCNPPFYESVEDMNASETLKVNSSNSSCTGAPCEMITPGGEVQFTLLQIKDSCVLRDRVQWYSTMLGKLSSVKASVEALKAHEITNYAVTEFVQGQTKRWGLAWSLMPWRPLTYTCRPTAYALQDVLPVPVKQIIDVSTSMEQVPRVLEDFVAEYAQDWHWTVVKQSLSTSITHDTWSRQARRRLHRSDNTVDPKDSHADVVMRVQFEILPQSSQIEVLWRYGQDAKLFESFFGKVKQIVLRQVGDLRRKR